MNIAQINFSQISFLRWHYLHIWLLKRRFLLWENLVGCLIIMGIHSWHIIYLAPSKMNYGWMFMTLYRRQESRPSPRKRNAKTQNYCLRRALQISVKRKEAKSKGEKERYKHLNAEYQRIARRYKNAFFSD